MSYDHRMAGQYDNRLSKATSMAKSSYGAGWAHLSERQQQAEIALNLIGLIGQIDFEGAVQGRLDDPKMAEKLLQKLVDITTLCSSIGSAL